MNTIMFWLLFFGLMPILYWSFRIIFDRLFSLLTPNKRLIIEVEQSDGTYTSTEINSQDEDSFYELSMKAIRNGK